jgi:murein L,D-transpeptidase YcbB/YkuD
MRQAILLVAAAALASTAPLRLRAADSAPLAPADRTAIANALAAAPGRGLPASAVDPAAADDQWKAAAVAYVAAERGHIDDPGAVDPDFALKDPSNIGAEFDAALAAGRLQAWLAGEAHDDPDLATLIHARDVYAAIVSAGGWPAVPPGKPPKARASDARIPVLRKRLAAEGYVAAPPAKAKAFDAALAAQLSAFQGHHELTPNGVLDAATLAALNVTADDRLAQIDANIERARWLPAHLPPTRIMVDTGEPQATLFENGDPTLAMRAIVGKPSSHTPTFASSVTAVKFNPPWNVPANIVASEILPKARRSPGYLARNDYYYSEGRLIQRPGPKSALGYVKFEMPDPYVIYLHDTPARTLFAKPARWLSHGCIRLEKPRELAAALLAAQGLARDDIDSAIAKRATQTVTLTTPPPVFIVYRTVVPAPDGRLTFRSDVYGWDAEIATALKARAASGQGDAVQKSP